MRKKWFITAVMLAVASGVGLSASLPDDIKVSLDDKRVQNLSPEGLELAFYITLNNLSSRTYRLTAYSYRFVVQDQEYFRLPAQPMGEGLQLDPSSASMIRLPVRITYENLFRTIQGIGDQHRIGCYIMGEMEFAEGRRRGGTLPFAFNAEFPIFRPPSLEMSSIQARTLTIGGADLELRIRITNPNGYQVEWESLEYDLRLGGHPIKKGLIRGPEPVPALSELTISLPLLFNFFEVGSDVHGLLLQGEVSCSLEGRVLLQTEWESVSLPVDVHGRVPVMR